MTFKDVIDEAFTPEIEKWLQTKLQTATNEKNQIDLQHIQAIQKEIAAQKAMQQQQQQKQPIQQAQVANVAPVQTATTAQVPH